MEGYRLRVLEHKVLRRIYGYKRQENERNLDKSA
jgi:hypothetical protein